MATYFITDFGCNTLYKEGEFDSLEAAMQRINDMAASAASSEYAVGSVRWQDVYDYQRESYDVVREKA